MTEYKERIYEENKLSEVIKELLINIDYYEESKSVFSKKIKTTKNSNELNVVSNHLELIEKNLRKNNIASLNLYFGRIDYTDKNESKEYSLYIGKQGIQDTKDKTLTVDWRAPISSVYYDCQLGDNVIEIFENEELDLELKLKRTLEIDNSKLINFYILGSNKMFLNYITSILPSYKYV